jgi:hypothetical protein
MPITDTLAEKDAIRELKARYFRCLDTKAWDEWRTVFTDDLIVRVDVTPSRLGEKGIPAPSPKGADAFVGQHRVSLADYVTVHHGHTYEITLTGPETATGIWAMEDIVQFPGSEGRMHGYGHYHEEYRKMDGKWRIARLYLKRLRVDYIGLLPPNEAQLAAMQAAATGA